MPTDGVDAGHGLAQGHVLQHLHAKILRDAVPEVVVVEAVAACEKRTAHTKKLLCTNRSLLKNV